NDPQLLDLPRRSLVEDLLEADRASLLAGQGLCLQTVAPLLRELAGAALVRDDLEALAGLRNVLHPQDLGRIARPGLLAAGAAEVEHRADLAPGGSCDHGVSDRERAAMHEHSGHR